MCLKRLNQIVFRNDDSLDTILLIEKVVSEGISEVYATDPGTTPCQTLEVNLEKLVQYCFFFGEEYIASTTL